MNLIMKKGLAEPYCRTFSCSQFSVRNFFSKKPMKIIMTCLKDKMKKSYLQSAASHLKMKESWLKFQEF